MKKIIILLIIAISFNYALAGIHQAPQNFMVENKSAVWVDFSKADYHIVYDLKTNAAYAESRIEFHQPVAGHPIFDSVEAPFEIYVDGKETSNSLVYTPGKITKVRMLKDSLSTGTHKIVIKTRIKKGTTFLANKVSSGFFIKDLTDRKFLEQYLPTNLEFDQYPMTIFVRIIGTKKLHQIFANGKVQKIDRNYFKIEYPSFYTASSVFFHLTPIDKFHVKTFKYRSISGRDIPITIYSKFKIRNNRLKKKTIRTLTELENDYGPWPHPEVLIYGTKLRGGMEYVGATVTSYVSLAHELQHSYFAKGILPANGNSGWMDEAIATWRDKGHKSYPEPNYYSFNLGNHSQYMRKTDDNSYSKGSSFLSSIDYKLRTMGKVGLKPFLKEYFKKRKFTTVTTFDFIHDLNEYADFDFSSDFNQYIFGINSDEKSMSNVHIDDENEHHPNYTEEELNDLI